jgi:hypothetical protein
MPLYKLRRDDSWIRLQQALPILPRSAEERRAHVRRLPTPARAMGLTTVCFVAPRLYHCSGGDLWRRTSHHRPWWATALLNMPRMK